MNIKIFKQNSLLSYLSLILLVHFLINGLSLLNWGIYWDDWSISHLSPEDLHRMYVQLGNPAFSYVFNYLFTFEHSVLIFRMAEFVCFGISGVCSFWIFDHFLKSKTYSLITSLIFISIPLNQARVSLICFPYVLCLALFSLGFVLSLRFRESVPVKALSFPLFFLSFLTNSIVLFYATVLLSIFSLENPGFRLENLKSLMLSFVKKHYAYILLPVIFVIFKFTVLPKPHGPYSYYNQVKFSFTRLTTEIVKAYFTTFGSICSILVPAILLVVAFSFLLKKSNVKKAYSRVDTSAAKISECVTFIFTAVYFAILPYVLIGRKGSEFGLEWEGRDTILLPFGYALLIGLIFKYVIETFFLDFFSFRRALTVLTGVTIIVFGVSNWGTSLEFLRDSIKQDAFLSFIKKTPEVRAHTSFELQDNMQDFNIYKRTYRSYELNAMVSTVLQNQDRYFFIAPSVDLESACASEVSYLHFCKSWDRATLIKRISFDPSNKKLSLSQTSKMVFFRYFDYQKYEDSLSEYFKFQIN